MSLSPGALKAAFALTAAAMSPSACARSTCALGGSLAPHGLNAYGYAVRLGSRRTTASPGGPHRRGSQAFARSGTVGKASTPRSNSLRTTRPADARRESGGARRRRCLVRRDVARLRVPQSESSASTTATIRSTRRRGGTPPIVRVRAAGYRRRCRFCCGVPPIV